MIQPLVDFIGHPAEAIIASTAGVTSSKQWLLDLRSSARKMAVSTDFPMPTIRQCAAVETAISDDSNTLLEFYVWLASGCLTTAFVMTQRSAALRRIETSENEYARNNLLATIRSGNSFATVGISHLTTSRRHLSQPPLRATKVSSGWVLDGFSPWVTGGHYADWLVIGAVEDDHIVGAQVPTKLKELLFSIPRDRTGVIVEPSSDLMALNASSTGPVRFEKVAVVHEELLHGPIENVMETSNRKPTSVGSPGTGSGPGGLQTSALAIGHAAQAIEYLLRESHMREDIRNVAEGLQSQWRAMFDELTQMNRVIGPQDQGALRKKANDLALNSTQAALAAAKGVGFANGHDVGRLCREALFFLVWSCPQSVVQAHLCSFMS